MRLAAEASRSLHVSEWALIRNAHAVRDGSAPLQHTCVCLEYSLHVFNQVIEVALDNAPHQFVFNVIIGMRQYIPE